MDWRLGIDAGVLLLAALSYWLGRRGRDAQLTKTHAETEAIAVEASAKAVQAVSDSLDQVLEELEHLRPLPAQVEALTAHVELLERALIEAGMPVPPRPTFPPMPPAIGCI